MPHCNCSKNKFYYYGLSSLIDEVENDPTLSGMVLFICAIECNDLMSIMDELDNYIGKSIKHVVIISDFFEGNVSIPCLGVTFMASSITHEDVKSIFDRIAESFSNMEYGLLLN
jgi:hypothetical protein